MGRPKGSKNKVVSDSGTPAPAGESITAPSASGVDSGAMPHVVDKASALIELKKVGKGGRGQKMKPEHKTLLLRAKNELGLSVKEIAEATGRKAGSLTTFFSINKRGAKKKVARASKNGAVPAPVATPAPSIPDHMQEQFNKFVIAAIKKDYGITVAKESERKAIDLYARIEALKSDAEVLTEKLKALKA